MINLLIDIAVLARFLPWLGNHIWVGEQSNLGSKRVERLKKQKLSVVITKPLELLELVQRFSN